MTIQYKVKFDEFEWESPIQDIRRKYLVQEGFRSRLLEHTKAMPPQY